MTKEEWEAVIVLMSQAPLQNMQHATVVDGLIDKVMKHARVGKYAPQPKAPAKRNGRASKK